MDQYNTNKKFLRTNYKKKLLHKKNIRTGHKVAASSNFHSCKINPFLSHVLERSSYFNLCQLRVID